MSFIHYIICPKCKKQLRIDGGWRGAMFCCAVYYWGAGNRVGSIRVLGATATEIMSAVDRRDQGRV